MQTIEQKREVFVRAFFKGLWPADCFEPLEIYEETGEARTGPARNPDGLRNLELLQKEINAIPTEDEVDLDYARKIFFRLRDIGNVLKQTLVRKPTAIIVQAPQPIDPATTLPHEDISQLKTIRNLTDVIRVKNLPKEKLMSFANLRVGSPTFHEFNQRIQHIIDHRIGDGDPPTVVTNVTKRETPTTSFNEPGTKNPEVLRTLNDVLSAIGQYRGASHAQTGKRQEALKETYNKFVSQVKSVADAEKLGRIIGEQMNKWDSGSIR